MGLEISLAFLGNSNTTIFFSLDTLPACIYLFKVNNGNPKAINEKFSKLTIKHQNDVNDFVLVSVLLILNVFFKGAS